MALLKFVYYIWVTVALMKYVYWSHWYKSERFCFFKFACSTWINKMLKSCCHIGMIPTGFCLKFANNTQINMIDFFYCLNIELELINSKGKTRRFIFQNLKVHTIMTEPLCCRLYLLNCLNSRSLFLSIESESHYKPW